MEAEEKNKKAESVIGVRGSKSADQNGDNLIKLVCSTLEEDVQSRRKLPIWMIKTISMLAGAIAVILLFLLFK